MLKTDLHWNDPPKVCFYCNVDNNIVAEFVHENKNIKIVFDEGQTKEIVHLLRTFSLDTFDMGSKQHIHPWEPGQFETIAKAILEAFREQ